jgi:light-regulated signal transduction histidine kinase (bacteriophytochrome)
MSATFIPGMRAEDMDACAREPIHIPGFVQPYGVLLVIDPESGRIVQASTNAAALLGVAPDAVLGAPWQSVLRVQGEQPSVTMPQAATSIGYAEAEFPQREVPTEHVWVAAWHLYPQQWQVELEPRDAERIEVSLRDALPTIRQLERDSSILEASHRVAREIHGTLGYDRVMVYRFDEDWNGDVIAEACRPELETYLGLHYPATDIPAQARALYLRNRVRQIAHVAYAPVAIEPTLHPQTGQPADLSDVTIRSVSPVHLEYLGNMGVSATLVTSIVINDALWGLIACHHYSPHFASHAMRDVADALTRALAGRIGGLQAVERARNETALLTVREKLITAFNDATAMTPELLGEMAPELMDVVDADGVAVFHGEHVTRYGTLPPDDGLARIREHIELGDHRSLREGAVGALHVDQIGKTFPELADLAPMAAGFIFVPLMPQSRSALLWTRREQIQTVNWAGNPTLTKLADIPNSRLSPRKSFDLWQETVRGRSRPWSTLHLEGARSLRVLIELMERKRYQQDFTMLEASLARLRQGVAIIEQIGGEHAPLRVAFVNPAFARLTGREAAELIGCELGQLYGSDASPEQVAQVQAQLRHGLAVYADLSLDVQDAAAQAFRFEFEPLPTGSDSARHWLLQLQEAERA